MKEILIYIGLAALCALILYLIVKSIIESIKREQFRRRNRETPFSGSAVKEEKGFWTSLFTPKYSSRAEAIGDYGSHLAATEAAEGHAGQLESPGSSRKGENGSHLEGTGATESHAGQVEGPGSSENAGIGAHLAAAEAAESHAGQMEGPGSSGNAGIGSHLEAAGAAEGRAGQVGGPGSSGNTGIGSHLAGAGSMRVIVRWCADAAARPRA